MLHDPNFLWTDSYLLFERVMDLGIKDLYYKQLISAKKLEEELEFEGVTDKEELHRLRKVKNL
jgi:hypothetical protein